METYLIEIQSKTAGKFSYLLKYNDEGDLVSAELRDLTKGLTTAQADYLWNFIPKNTMLIDERGKLPHCKVIPLETDLSFDAFWNLYNYKLGNKDRTIKHWAKLDDNTKAMVMKKVKEYNYFIANSTTGKVFAERFLSQKRYENDFTVPK